MQMLEANPEGGVGTHLLVAPHPLGSPVGSPQARTDLAYLGVGLLIVPCDVDVQVPPANLSSVKAAASGLLDDASQHRFWGLQVEVTVSGFAPPQTPAQEPQQPLPVHDNPSVKVTSAWQLTPEGAPH